MEKLRGLSIGVIVLSGWVVMAIRIDWPVAGTMITPGEPPHDGRISAARG